MCIDGRRRGGTPPVLTQPGCDYFVRPRVQLRRNGGTAGGSARPRLNVQSAGADHHRANLPLGIPRQRFLDHDRGGPHGLGQRRGQLQSDPNDTAFARTGNSSPSRARYTPCAQAAGSACSYSISPTSNTVSSSGGFGAINVNASPQTCDWTAVSQVPGSASTMGQDPPPGGAMPPSNTPWARTRPCAAHGHDSGRRAHLHGYATAGRHNGRPAGSGQRRSPLRQRHTAVASGRRRCAGSFFTIFGVDIGPGAPAQVTAFPISTLLGSEVRLRRARWRSGRSLIFAANPDQRDHSIQRAAWRRGSDCLLQRQTRPAGPNSNCPQQLQHLHHRRRARSGHCYQLH